MLSAIVTKQICSIAPRKNEDLRTAIPATKSLVACRIHNIWFSRVIFKTRNTGCL